MDSPRIYIYKVHLDAASSLTTNALVMGTDYCTLRIPESYVHNRQQDMDVTYWPGGTHVIRWDTVKKDIMIFQGMVKEDTIASTITVKGACEQYFSNIMGRSTGPEGFVVKLTATDYDKWSNTGGSSVNVLRGALDSMSCRWDSSEGLGFYVNGGFKVAWS